PAQVEVKRVQERPAETVLDTSVVTASLDLPAPPALIVASRQEVSHKVQGVDNTTPGNTSSAQLIYANWEAQLTELKNKWLHQMKDDFQNILDTITSKEAQDALKKLQAEKTAKKQMYNALQMYTLAEASFLEDTRAMFADFGSRTLALHEGVV
ncbi:unnamed protein product, partial [Aureobasidium uvarum]